MAWIRKNTFATFCLCAKEFEGGNFIHFHLVGCMVFNGQMSPRIYFTAPNIHNDANFTITIIHHVITHWSNNLPQVLYLQLDNTRRENKNQIVFGYLNMLVELGIFQKVKVDFLIVGHTHSHIDHMFIHFAVTLGRKNVVFFHH